MYEDWNKNDSGQAEDNSAENGDYRGDADTYSKDTGACQDDVSTCSNDAETYPDGTNTYSNDAETYPDGADAYSNDTGTYPDSVNTYSNDAGTYSDNTGTYSESAGTYSGDANAYSNEQPGGDSVNREGSYSGYSGGYTGPAQQENSEYSSQGQNFEYQPRWQPDTEKYNTYYDNTPEPEKKKRKKWWIPVVIILAAMVVVVAVIISVGTDVVKDPNGDTTSESQVAEAETSDSSLILGDNEGASSANTVSTADAEGVVLVDVSSVVEEVMPAIVSITSRSLVNNGSSYWGYFYGESDDTEEEEVDSGYGSGTIVAQNATQLLILTSFHVVEDSSSFYITFCDGSTAEAYLKATAEDSDIAIVAVNLEDISDETRDEIKIATLRSEDVEIGEGVIVIGNALGYGQSVTTGIVSAKDKEITVDEKTVITIQTDAAINGGNSGGATLDVNGNVIGISEAKIQSTSVEGMGYSISIYNNYDLIMELLTTETTEEEETTGDISEIGTGYLGIYGRDLSAQLASQYGLPTSQGVFVAGVVSDSGAEAAGLTAGDIITGIDGTTITSMTDLQSAIATHSAGDTVTLDVLKYSQDGYTEATVEVTLTAQIG